MKRKERVKEECLELEGAGEDREDGLDLEVGELLTDARVAAFRNQISFNKMKRCFQKG